MYDVQVGFMCVFVGYSDMHDTLSGGPVRCANFLWELKDAVFQITDIMDDHAWYRWRR